MMNATHAIARLAAAALRTIPADIEFTTQGTVIAATLPAGAEWTAAPRTSIDVADRIDAAVAAGDDGALAIALSAGRDLAVSYSVHTRTWRTSTAAELAIREMVSWYLSGGTASLADRAATVLECVAETRASERTADEREAALAPMVEPLRAAVEALVAEEA